MRFGWLIPVVLLVVVAATVIGWMLARRAGERSGKKGWVANTGFLRDLPKYQALVRRTRSSLAMAVVCFIIAVIATSVSAGAPEPRHRPVPGRLRFDASLRLGDRRRLQADHRALQRRANLAAAVEHLLDDDVPAHRRLRDGRRRAHRDGPTNRPRLQPDR